MRFSISHFRNSAPAIALAGFAVLVSSPAAAHHSFAMFDPAQVTVLDGTVKLFQWVNPHAVIWLDVPDGKGGSAIWAIEMTGPGPLRRMGWTPDSLKVGDKVSAKLHPLRDGRPGGQFLQLTLSQTGQVLGTLGGARPGDDKPSE
jgi:hypothetical protein